MHYLQLPIVRFFYMYFNETAAPLPPCISKGVPSTAYLTLLCTPTHRVQCMPWGCGWGCGWGRRQVHAFFDGACNSCGCRPIQGHNCDDCSPFPANAVQWVLSIQDILNRGHPSNEDAAWCPSYIIELCTKLRTFELRALLYRGQTAGP